MVKRRGLGLALVAVQWACGGDGEDPLVPIVDDVSPEEGVAACTPEGSDGSWSFARIGAGTKPALAVTPDGTAHVAFMSEAIEGWIRYARLPSGANGASTPEQASTGYFYGPIEILLGEDGEPRILYHDHDREDQVLATRVGGQWDRDPMVQPGHDGWYNAGLVDEEGRVHTATYDPRGFNGRGVNYGVWDGSAWSVELAAPGSFDYAGGMSILESSQGIEILFFDDLAGVAKWARRSAPNEWSVSTVEPLGSFLDVGRFPDAAYDAESATWHLVHLARMSAGSGTVRYASGTPDALDFEDIASVDGFTIGFSGARDLATVALDADGEAYVAIQTSRELSVLRLAPTGPETLAAFAAANDVAFGQQTEIAVDGQGRPHVVWWQSGEAPGTVCHARMG